MAYQEDTTGQDVGSFFKGLGEGVVRIVGGLAGTLESGNNYNNAVANQINANAQTAPERQRQIAQQQAQERKMIIFVFIIILAIPLVAVTLLKK